MQFSRPKRFVHLFIIFIVAFYFCEMPKIAVAEQNQPDVREHWRNHKIDGKTMEAIQSGKKLVDYFTARFQPVSLYIYVEKSSEGDIFHSFYDWKDLAAYKQGFSERMSDPEWLCMAQEWISTYTKGAPHGTLLTSWESFTLSTPVADLSKGQEGNIFFSSINLGSFKEILAGEGQSKPVTISGTLKMPEKIAGKLPAVIILHGAGGINDHYFEVAEMLNEIGIAAFVVDSFQPRGITSGENILKKFFHSYSTRISDAYAALERLSTHPKIDKRKIAVMGYSHGAAVALFVASEKIRWSYIADDLKFMEV